MVRHTLIAACLLAACLLGACSGADNGPPGSDGGGKTDAPPADAGALPTALQVVVNRIILPKDGTEYALDLDGDGIDDNQLGRVLAALASFSSTYDSQKDLDDALKAGKVLLLFELLARSLVDAAPVRLRFHEGADTDGDATNNFSGAATLGPKPGSAADVLAGKVAAGQLTAGPGSLIFPVPVGLTPTAVRLRAVRVAAKVAASGMTGGALYGAAPWSEVDGKLLPALAKEMDTTWKATTDPSMKSFVGTFDTDKDGTISAQDLKTNGLIGLLFKADVDTDGDKKKDAMSLGVGFTAVTCKIKQ